MMSLMRAVPTWSHRAQRVGTVLCCARG